MKTETAVNIVSLGPMVGIILVPILIIRKINGLNIRYKFLAFLASAVFITSILALIFAWWVDTSNEMLLSHYGYDFDALNEAERFQQVSPENRDRVQQLEISSTGLGWPLKAYMTYILFLPYLLIVYLAAYWIQTFQNMLRHKTERRS